MGLLHGIPGNPQILFAFILEKAEVRIAPHKHHFESSKVTGKKRYLRHHSQKTGHFLMGYLPRISAVKGNAAAQRGYDTADSLDYG
jgi:hypothetical protein